jgi:hypothetical protein
MPPAVVGRIEIRLREGGRWDLSTEKLGPEATADLLRRAVAEIDRRTRAAQAQLHVPTPGETKAICEAART